jgi:hypothetical protein
MGRVVGAKAVATSETAVHFSTPSEAPWHEVQGFAEAAEAKMWLPPAA